VQEQERSEEGGFQRARLGVLKNIFACNVCHTVYADEWRRKRMRKVDDWKDALS
jgi:hypothetical protein